MNFSIRNLSVLSYAQGFTLWHYRAHAEDLATCLADGFFSPAADMISFGDMILISARDGGAQIFCKGMEKAPAFLLMNRT